MEQKLEIRTREMSEIIAFAFANARCDANITVRPTIRTVFIYAQLEDIRLIIPRVIRASTRSDCTFTSREQNIDKDVRQRLSRFAR